MKNRLQNILIRIFKYKFLAEVVGCIFYALLLGYYYIARLVLKIIKIKKIDTQEAREYLMRINPKPKMSGTIINGKRDPNIDLSIIMPAYNVEKYIDDSVHSIINQKTKYRYELIIVNDGSTDNTEKIVEQIKHENIRYIKQENKGLSGARNTGTNIAKGSYLMFVDSDDVMTENSIETMMDEIKRHNADIVVGGYYTFSENNDTKQYFVKNKEIIENNASKSTFNIGFAWGKVFKYELFEKIRFPEGSWYEDTIMCCVLHRLCRKMIVLDEAVYGYRVNPKGISKMSKKSAKCIDHYWVMEEALQQAKINGLQNDEIQYALVKSHMSSLMRWRLIKMDNTTMLSVFTLACDILDSIRPNNYKCEGNLLQRDIEKAFQTRNYKLWKMASFVV